MTKITVVVDEDPNVLKNPVQVNYPPGSWAAIDSFKKEYDSVVPEFDRQINGIGMGIQAIESLHEIRTKLEGLETIDPATYKMAQVASEAIFDSLRLHRTSPSLESYGNKETALETIGGFIKAIFQAIIDTFKSIWKFISELFSSSREEKKQEAFKQTAEVAKSGKASDAPLKDAVNPHLLRNFQHLGEHITIKDIESEIKKYENSVTHFSTTLKAYKVMLFTYMLSFEKAESLKECRKAFDDSIVTFSKTIDEMYDYIDHPGNYSQELNELRNTGILGSENYSNIRVLDGFPRGQLLAKIPYVHEEISFIKFKVLERNFTNAIEVNCKLPTKNEVSDFAKSLTDIASKSKMFSKTVDENLSDNKVLSTLSKVQHVMEQGAAETSDPEVMTSVQLFKLLSTMTRDLTELIMLIDETDLLYIKLGNEFNSVYYGKPVLGKKT